MKNVLSLSVWITKYALTKGIYKTGGEISADGAFRQEGSYPRYFHAEGREWHRTRESAVKRAEAMRTAKIKSLKQQIEKLEKMSFESDSE